MKSLLIGLLLLSTSAHAEFNGEKLDKDLGMGWRMGAGCPEYVLSVAHDILAISEPVPHTYNGLLPIPPTMAYDGQTIIYCSEQQPGQAVEIPDPDVTKHQAFTVAGMTTWWTNSQGRILEYDIWLRVSTLNALTVHRFLWHEFFHGWGLQHDPDPLSLMYYAPTVDEPYIYDLAELSRLYEQCEDIADKNANLFVSGVDMSRWILDQPQLVQDQLSDFIGKKVSFVQKYATTYPDMVQRVELSNCGGEVRNVQQ